MATGRQVIRASDADRERVVARLREHFGAGRLSDEEFSARVDRAYASATTRDLEALTADLPEAPGGQVERPQEERHVTPGGRALRASFRIHAWIFVMVNVLLIGIWAAAGGGYFWPVWSILGWGMGLAGHYAPIAAGAGTRSWRDHRTPDELAAEVNAERPALPPAPDGTVTILFSDIAGSTELNDRLGDLRWLELLRRHHEIVRERVREHGGHEVKAQGDGFMVVFPSARNAVLCARAILQAIGDRLGGEGVEVRIGLHTGEALREDGDFYGRNVTLAARIAAQARPGEILASSVVKHLTQSAGDIRFGEPETVDLKGLGTETLYPVA